MFRALLWLLLLLLLLLEVMLVVRSRRLQCWRWYGGRHGCGGATVSDGFDATALGSAAGFGVARFKDSPDQDCCTRDGCDKRIKCEPRRCRGRARACVQVGDD